MQVVKAEILHFAVILVGRHVRNVLRLSAYEEGGNASVARWRTGARQKVFEAVQMEGKFPFTCAAASRKLHRLGGRKRWDVGCYDDWAR